ncbi:MAG: PDDEXK nuclease domain-containing protein, partial [Sulfurimonas sp.]|nr:PDDEXK nuclease domain-containing protein [Sulfurimonas sp.]
IDMYVNTSADLEKDGSDNPTIGIILCTDKDETVVKYSHINDRDNFFVSKYQMVLPTEEELIRKVEGDVLEIGLEKEGNLQSC